MAAGYLAEPGKKNDRGEEIGPCVDACEHRDCASTRRMAESSCTICGEPIGYETGFFRAESGDDPHVLDHALCVYRREEQRAR